MIVYLLQIRYALWILELAQMITRDAVEHVLMNEVSKSFNVMPLSGMVGCSLSQHIGVIPGERTILKKTSIFIRCSTD